MDKQSIVSSNNLFTIKVTPATPQSAQRYSNHTRSTSMTIVLSLKKTPSSVKPVIKKDKTTRLDVLRKRLSFSPNLRATAIRMKSPKLSPIPRCTPNSSKKFHGTASVPNVKKEESHRDNSLLNENMTIETVLKSIHLMRYSKKLCNAGINLERFLELDDQALKNIGVCDWHDRRNILLAINDFK